MSQRQFGLRNIKIRKNNAYNSTTTVISGNNSTTSRVSTNSVTEMPFVKGVSSAGGPIDRWSWKIHNGVGASSSLNAEGFECQWNPSSFQESTVTTFSPSERTVFVAWATTWVSNSPPPRGAQLSDSSANNRALSILVSKARQAQSSFQGGVFIGELREALRLLRPASWALARGMETGYLEAVRNRIHKFGKRRDPRSRVSGRKTTVGISAGQKAQVISDTWLEYSFGWRPFVSDIESASAEISRLINTTKPESKRVKGASGSQMTSEVQGNGLSGANGELLVRLRRTYGVDVRYKAAVKIECSGVNSVRQSLSLGLQDFAPTVWELIPWSFLVDYFVNIDDIVSAATFPTSSLVYCIKGTKWENVHEALPGGVTRTPSGPIQARQFSGSAGRSRFKAYGVIREPYVGSLVPSLEFKLPGMGTQAFNLLALATASKRVSRQISQL